MLDHKRPHVTLSCLTSLALALAFVPACEDVEQLDEELAVGEDDEFRSESCPANWNIYGQWAGGFCCDGYTDGNTCNGSICALDPSRTQGHHMCSDYDCPSGWDLYGVWAGGFCCDGYTNGDTCDGNVCALDPYHTQGNPECSDYCPGGTTSMSGMCCNSDGSVCDMQWCPEAHGYQVCFSSAAADVAMNVNNTACTFIATSANVGGVRFTVPDYWQTHTSSVVARSCGDVDLENVFVYDGYGQTSDSNVFGDHPHVNGKGGTLYPWIQNDARSMWLSASERYTCLVHNGSSEWRTCVPPSSTVFNLAPDFDNAVQRIDIHPNWVGVAADIWENQNAGGQSIYVSSNENFYYRPILTGGQWLRWDAVISSFRFKSL